MTDVTPTRVMNRDFQTPKTPMTPNFDGPEKIARVTLRGEHREARPELRLPFTISKSLIIVSVGRNYSQHLGSAKNCPLLEICGKPLNDLEDLRRELRNLNPTQKRVQIKYRVAEEETDTVQQEIAKMEDPIKTTPEVTETEETVDQERPEVTQKDDEFMTPDSTHTGDPKLERIEEEDEEDEEDEEEQPQERVFEITMADLLTKKPSDAPRHNKPTPVGSNNVSANVSEKDTAEHTQEEIGSAEDLSREYCTMLINEVVDNIEKQARDAAKGNRPTNSDSSPAKEIAADIAKRADFDDDCEEAQIAKQLVAAIIEKVIAQFEEERKLEGEATRETSPGLETVAEEEEEEEPEDDYRPQVLMFEQTEARIVGDTEDSNRKVCGRACMPAVFRKKTKDGETKKKLTVGGLLKGVFGKKKTQPAASA